MPPAPPPLILSLSLGLPFQLWVNIVNGDVQDSTRTDLYEYIVDFLTYCLDQQLVWTYADWVLQKSQEVRAAQMHSFSGVVKTDKTGRKKSLLILRGC